MPIMKESDIIHENGRFWVGKADGAYYVFRVGLTHSVSDSAYPLTPDGLTIAKSRCDYLARRGAKDGVK